MSWSNTSVSRKFAVMMMAAVIGFGAVVVYACGPTTTA